ncbi:MAG: elongation factor T [Parcubacteria group bacterium Licking1014_17]|nr:MAG: elongation factor T [Parcubacteria group bacterium Licking1014_17]
MRNATEQSFNDIKKALEEAGGDEARALEILKERGAVIAEKKSARSTNEGIVASYIHSTGKVGVLVELLCETDFVACNELFPELAHELAMHIAAMDPQSMDELLSQPYIKDQDMKVEDLVTQYVSKLGENIKINRFVRFAI